jgi:hemin uptake protein HemP
MDLPARNHEAAPTPDAAPRWRSDELLRDAPEAFIEHGGSVYRLRRTLLGKLILTK